MSNENIELVSSGLKCDNPVCDWKDTTIKVENWHTWINAKCPKCEANLLTLEDYNNAIIVIKTAELLNEFTEEELAEMSAGKTIEDIEAHPMIKDAKGLEHLTDLDERVIMSVGTHKGVKIIEFKPLQ